MCCIHARFPVRVYDYAASMSGFDTPDYDICRIHARFHLSNYDCVGGFVVKAMQLKHRCPSLARASFKALGAGRIVAELLAVK